MELTDLLVNRAEFLKHVSAHVASDIKHNGLELENVTLSSLDQTRTDVLRSGDNIFDAQGARKITESRAAGLRRDSRRFQHADRRAAGRARPLGMSEPSQNVDGYREAVLDCTIRAAGPPFRRDCDGRSRAGGGVLPFALSV
jgi:hypothetical protein